METCRELPRELLKKKIFSKSDFSAALSRKYEMTDPQITYDLGKRIERGEIIRIGWGQFTLPEKKSVYRHFYSDASNEVAEEIKREYADLDFQIFELIQLNEFMNHQIAHNTIIIGVENDLMDFVFDTLWKSHPGKVMLKPTVNDYYRYLQDDEIIVNRLPSETPKGLEVPWQCRLEKILVDVLVDKLVSEIVPENEKQAIVGGAFDTYLIDEKTMIRYAKRKGATGKLMQALSAYGRTLER